MANLLPRENKEKLFKDFLTRLSVIFFIFSFFTICIATISLLPSYALSFVKESSIKDEALTFDKTIEFREESTPVDILNQEREKIDALSGLSENNAKELIFKIIKNKPSNIKITGLFYDKNKEDGLVELVFNGTANDRNILVDFVNELEKESKFSNVDFPVSSLIQGDSINFSVKISIE